MMPEEAYHQLKISNKKAEEIANSLFGIKGSSTQLPGELDMNFRITCPEQSYILKISRPGTDDNYIDFQQKILQFVANSRSGLTSPIIYNNLNNEALSVIKDELGKDRKVRLYSWIDGRLWSSVNPVKNELLYSLGKEAGKLTSRLTGFDHPFAHRDFEWNLSNADWTVQYIEYFKNNEREIVQKFQDHFNRILPDLKKLRHSVVHNDANDNNVVVSNELKDPEVMAIIDYGDAIHTATINDLAITIAYAIMGKPDPLKAALPLISGYHHSHPMLEKELEMLYTLVAMRLIVSVTKSAINKKKEPGNEYLTISEKPAWEVLRKWVKIDENFAHFCFRKACGYHAIQDFPAFVSWAEENTVSLNTIFPTLNFDGIEEVDMSISSLWLENKNKYEDIKYSADKIRALQNMNSAKLIAGGYHEIRPFYSTSQFSSEGNNGPEYRSMHLGVDFWVEKGTAIHAPYEGKIVGLHNNDEAKDYGPTLILEHDYGNKSFYTLYGHLGMSVIELLQEGQSICKNELIGYVGGHHENGGWVPHLHFQIILDLLGNTINFPGVALPADADIWKEICPNPGMVFNIPGHPDKKAIQKSELLEYRKKHLGKSLSLSYDTPLEILRGDGVYLIDSFGRRYLDTVNNVAHVGHEHPRIILAGQSQMALLNTNTRYLHPNIVDFTKELLETFPPKLSVVHFVNSGSEANELALRMAKAYTNQKDIIALEVGYHGNTGACIDISSYKFDGKGGSGAPEHTHIVPLPDTFRGKYQGKGAGNSYAAHIQEKINEVRAKGRDVAAFICESIISCGGQIELAEGYLTSAYAAIRKAGGVCIADEVQVGCGRVGKSFWGFQMHGVIPDIVTIGKPIGNGHPLAAVVCTKEIADSFANGMEYFNTFGGNPVSCAIGEEVLRVIKDEKLQNHALSTGNYLKEQLSQLQSEFPIIGDIRGQGLFLGFELNKSNKEPLGKHAEYLANRMKDLGILMSTDGPDHNVLKIKPPMVFSIDNADELIRRLRQVFNEDYMMAYDG